MNELFSDMLSKGLASTSSTWIEREVQQRNLKLMVLVAATRLFRLDEWDVIMLRKQALN